jgi:trans-2,3-dihydro-3-hydroxyanthranilate isomerase
MHDDRTPSAASQALSEVEGRTVRGAAPLPYAIYDVFSGTPLEGNPLAVVFEADHLSDEAMQRVAREFNLSETIFVRAPEQAGHAARVRIFTPVHELPFAGHPTVGAAVAIAQARNASAGENGHDLDTVLVLEETVGNVRCVVKLRNGARNGSAAGQAGFAEFDLPRLSVPVACSLDREQVAEALGVAARHIGFENHAVSVRSAGVPYVLVPLHDRSVVESCTFDPSAWEALAPIDGGLVANAYVYCRGGVDHLADFHARMFGAGSGIAEDPATGSAAAALSGAIHHFDGLLDGHHARIIEQGVEMGRPSKIHLHIDVDKGAVSRARIGGEAIRVAQGHLFL